MTLPCLRFVSIGRAAARRPAAGPASMPARALARRGGALAATVALGALLAGAWPTAQAAGTVSVRFTDPARYTDAGRRDRFDRQPTLEALARHLEKLGARSLPDGQTLAVEVLDIDLAGEFRPTARGDDLRVLRGAADWPRLKLRYVLSEGARTLAQGEEVLSDLDYLGTPRATASGDTLAHEKRLLDDWFARRFGAAARAAG